MPIRENFRQRAAYRSIKKANSPGNKRRIEDVQGEILEFDLNDVLGADSEIDFAKLVEKYAFFENSQEPELTCNLIATCSENTTELIDQAAVSAVGYMDMQRHMKKVIHLKALCESKYLSRDDLREAGIEIKEASIADRLQAALAARYIEEVAEATDTPDDDQTLIEAWESQRRMTYPIFTCIDYVTNSNSPYGKHLQFGIDLYQRQEAECVNYEKTERGFTFDAISGQFPDNTSGYKKALLQALDNMFRINLANAPTVTNAGILEQKCLTVYAAFWYELALKLEGGRAMRCEACGKPLITTGERGVKRRFCGDACRKWAQRNPGKKRKAIR